MSRRQSRRKPKLTVLQQLAFKREKNERRARYQERFRLAKARPRLTRNQAKRARREQRASR